MSYEYVSDITIEALFTILLETGLMLQIMHHNDYCVLDVSLLIQTSLFSALLYPLAFTQLIQSFYEAEFEFFGSNRRIFKKIFVRPPQFFVTSSLFVNLLFKDKSSQTMKCLQKLGIRQVL